MSSATRQQGTSSQQVTTTIHAPPPSNIGVPVEKSNVQIHEVWADNLHDEMRKIIQLVDRYNFIAMDTEFPGIVTRPTKQCPASEYNYEMMRLNVDNLKMIQLGICLCDEQGNYLPNLCCWQFNFKFSTKDTFAPDSLELLKKSGINFAELESRGIEWNEFAEVFMTSGIVLNPRINWVSFHSGFDFAYMIRVLTAADLPKTDAQFFALLHIFCPVIYDIKYIMKACEPLKGGLQRIAEVLDVHRIGPQHQAGSDALLTAATFFKMRTDYFDSWLDDSKYRGVIFGLNCPPYTGPMPTPATGYAAALAYPSALACPSSLLADQGALAALTTPPPAASDSTESVGPRQQSRPQPSRGGIGLAAFASLSLSPASISPAAPAATSTVGSTIPGSLAGALAGSLSGAPMPAMGSLATATAASSAAQPSSSGSMGPPPPRAPHGKRHGKDRDTRDSHH